MANSHYIQERSAKLKRRTSVSLLWHGEESHKHCYAYDTRLCHSSCSHRLLHHFVVPRCRPTINKKKHICNNFFTLILIEAVLSERFLRWRSAQSALCELCVFGLLWRNLSNASSDISHLAAHISHGQPSSRSTGKQK